MRPTDELFHSEASLLVLQLVAVTCLLRLLSRLLIVVAYPSHWLYLSHVVHYTAHDRDDDDSKLRRGVVCSVCWEATPIGRADVCLKCL